MAGMSLQMLDLGRLTIDDGFFLAGSGLSTLSNPNPDSPRREVAVMAAVIEHPKAGPILFETGCAENSMVEWGPIAADAFPLTTYTEENHLDVALADAGYAVTDIKAVIMGHLHLDHAGGLEKFKGTATPIYVHEQELREQWYQVITNQAGGVYVPGDLHRDLNWKPLPTLELELFDGITLRHMPGHTPGLMTMQVEMPNSGNWFFASDLFHIREQYETPYAPGWLLGHSRTEWWRNRIWMENLVRQKDGRLVFGHDAPTLESLIAEAKVFD